MEIRFKLATEPAVKGTIAVVSCVSIAHVATHTKTPYKTMMRFRSIGLSWQFTIDPGYDISK